MRKTAIATIVATAVFMFCFQTSQVSAAEPVESITLTPTSKTYKVDPGQVFEDSLTILNDGDTAYDFTVYGSPYSVESGTYDPSYTSDAANADAYTWVQFKQATWHAEPHQTIKVSYTVHVKKNASPGGHYGVLFAEVQPADTSGLARKKRVGAVIYATVSGDVNLKGASAGTNIGWFQSSAPLKATTSIQNTGNSDFTAKISYQASDIFGSVKYKFQSDYVILPATTRDITLSWAGVPWFGLYKVQLTTEFLGQTNIGESYVLIMPIWLVTLLGAVIVSGGIYAIWRWSHRVHHQTR